MKVNSFTPNNGFVDTVFTQEEIKRRAVLKSYRTLYQLASQSLIDENIIFLKLIKKAFRFIFQVHRNVDKNINLDIISQSIEIALITIEKFKLGAKSVVCALLYDVVKNDKITLLNIREEFGTEVANVIEGLVRIHGPITTPLNSEMQANKLGHVLEQFTSENLLVVLIKFAELLQEMYKIEELAPAKQTELVEEVYGIYIPLAKNIGLHTIYLELEDLHLKFKHRIVYDSIMKKIKATKTSKEGFLERFIKPLCKELEKEKVKFILKARTKSISSICHKIKVRNVPFEAIYDFYAVRIIFESNLDDEYTSCWSIYELVTNLYEPKISHLRDWVSYPRESGYEALHITVMSPEGQWVEIQIRARRMDENAEHGEAAHWKYKSSSLGKKIDNLDDKWMENARAYLMANSVEKQPLEISIIANKMYVEATWVEQ